MPSANQTGGAGQVTRGGLVPAKITNLVTNEEIHFMFNPEQYTLTKSNSWTPKIVTGKNLPQVIFQSGGAQSLSLKLYFDSIESGDDVQDYTKGLWTMMMIDESNENADSGKGTPPPVAFEWGSLYFKAIMTKLSQNFTLFNEQGIPLRCEVNVDLQQFLDIVPASQDGTSTSGASAPSSETAVQGDRMDLIASRTSGDPSNYREVASQNNIDDPQNLRNGQQIRA